LSPPEAASPNIDGKFTMKVLIIGATGMVGRKLTDRLVHDGAIANRTITDLHL
jgi:N-acetyl-gamma-glutamylphosphate reductase